MQIKQTLSEFWKTANTTGNIDAEKYNRNFEKLCEAITKIEEEVLLPEEIMQ